MNAAAKRIAIIGGGWAGLAAAVKARQRGYDVTLYEMAKHLGGRARQVESQGAVFDNGQHILIGAYTETLGLMKLLGVEAKRALKRTPLRVVYPDGSGLKLQPGSPALAFARAVCSYPSWGRDDKWALLKTTGLWAWRRFQCAPHLTVAQLTAHLPERVRSDLLDPLCVAALNTPATQASAAVFLRVLKDALFSGPGSADLLLPRMHLTALLPEPAARWLAQNGASVRLGQRVDAITPEGEQWRVAHAAGHELFDGVVLACTTVEAARLAEPHAPQWAAQAQSLHYEPIITVYAQTPHTRLPEPMLALRSDAQAPAQFVFDLGALGGMDGVLAFVISGASAWAELGSDAVMAATLRQGHNALKPLLSSPLVGLRAFTERRATFLCSPELQRPSASICPGLCAAGDYVAGPYPATLEGAVRSGLVAIDRLFDANKPSNPTKV